MPWPETAQPTLGGGWRWTAPAGLDVLERLPDQRVLVGTNGRVGVLDADGSLLWTAPGPGLARAMGDNMG